MVERLRGSSRAAACTLAVGAHSDVLGRARVEVHVPPCEPRIANPEFAERHLHRSTHDVVCASAWVRYAALQIRLCTTSADISTIAPYANRLGSEGTAAFANLG